MRCPGFCKKEGISVEEAGRLARQNALFERAEKLKQSQGKRVSIAFAHNRDDQAETVLMRMLRGTGVHGLSAMEYSRADGIIRPLLDTARKDVEVYCAAHSLAPRWDSTNASKEFTRNRLRLDLIPLLEKDFNPALKESLVRLSNNAREDDCFLEKLAEEKMDQATFSHLQEGNKAYPTPSISYKLSDMEALDPAVGKRLIKLLFAKLGLHEDVAYVHLQSLWEALKSNKHGTICEFPQNYKAEISYRNLLFYRAQPSVQPLFDWHLKQTVLRREEAPEPKNLPPCKRVFDAEKVQALGIPLSLRTRLSGDYIQPLGFSGTKKLQDYFVDAKIARACRDSHPLVCMGHEVVWVLDGPINDKYKITDRTQIVLLLEIEQGIC